MGIPKLLYVSLAIEFVAGLYLLLFDKLLFSLGLLHWFGLLLFLLLNALLLLGSMGRLRGAERAYMKIMSGINILGFILFILDAALGLPFTKFNPGISLNSSIGWSYLFGFGTNAVSSFGTSLGFTVLLLTALISGISFAYLSRKR
ncbi:MAG: hypothetical protein M1603_02265 [Candidatus Marsarchaeota archaeon]|nr:hypothetical protein [Candidatus Marsarchaeota archaeon]